MHQGGMCACMAGKRGGRVCCTSPSPCVPTASLRSMHHGIQHSCRALKYSLLYVVDSCMLPTCRDARVATAQLRLQEHLARFKLAGSRPLVGNACWPQVDGCSSKLEEASPILTLRNSLPTKRLLSGCRGSGSVTQLASRLPNSDSLKQVVRYVTTVR